MPCRARYLPSKERVHHVDVHARMFPHTTLKSMPVCSPHLQVKLIVPHLDGHPVHVTSTPGQIIAHESVLQVEDEGMPIYSHSQIRGALFVQFDVSRRCGRRSGAVCAV